MFEIRPGRGNVVELIGRLDVTEADSAAATLESIDGDQILDFSRLEYISSAGLGVLLGVHKRLADSGGCLKLTNLQGHVRDVFRYAGLDRVFEIVDSPVIADEADPDRPAVPEYFRYKILEKIGEGHTGQVFLGRDLTLDRKVAVKFLSDKMLANETARRRFLREARSAAALDNPFICKVLEAGEAKGKLYIAMEYLEGKTLESVLAKGSLDWRKAVKLAGEIAEALEGAHRARILHRDLRPANIMLTPSDHVKVMDFGSAKPLEGAEWVTGDGTLTIDAQDQSLMLDLEYHSPEQLRGKELTHQSDLFSFGIVLYEMLTGVHPFKEAQPGLTMVSILSKAPEPIGKYNTDIPAGLERIVGRMLAKEPADRYGTAKEVLQDLEKILEDPNHLADAGPSESESKERPSRKRPGWWPRRN